MKRYWIVFICLFCTWSVSAQQDIKPQKRFTWGVSAGANAPFVDMRKAMVGDRIIESPAVSTNVGYHVALFSRLNMNRHYLQLEASTHYTHINIHLKASYFASDLSPEIQQQTASVSNRTNSIDVPLLYGYRFVKQGPYELSFFAGPKIKYVFREKNRIDNESIYNIKLEAKQTPVTANFVLGLGTAISNLLLDFRYEFGITNIVNNVGYNLTMENQVIEGDVYLKRGVNLLSFSIGFIF